MNIIDILTDVISPKEAEAKVVVSDENDPVKYVLKAIEQGQVLNEKALKNIINKDLSSGKSNPALRYVYQMILKAAEADPDTVTIGSKGDMLAPGTLGYYDRAKKHINISTVPTPGMVKYPTDQGYQNTVAHELLHFLSRDIDKSQSKQHSFVEQTLGVPSEDVMHNDLENAVPFTMPPNAIQPALDKEVYEAWKRKVFGAASTDDQLSLERKSSFRQWLDWLTK